MNTIFAWLMVGMTVLLTCYGQIVLKWQATTFKPALQGIFSTLPVTIQLVLRPWVISAFAAAFAASLCWILAMSKLELSKAYPFMALNFVIVSIAAVPLFGESFSIAKTTGLATVVVGLIILSQA